MNMTTWAVASYLTLTLGAQLVTANTEPTQPSAGPTPIGCEIDGHTLGGLAHRQGVVVKGECIRGKAPGPRDDKGAGSGKSAQTPSPATRVVDCGPAKPTTAHPKGWDTVTCGPTPLNCATKDNPDADAFLTEVEDGGYGLKGWRGQSGPWCPATPTTAVPPASIRSHAIRLLPKISIGTAPIGTTLINIQTILWAGTNTIRSLGTPTVTGQPVAIRVRFTHANWDYGDGNTDSLDQPGKPYTDADPCKVVSCPDYQGHIFTTTGTKTVTMSVTWSAQYRIGNGPWQNLDGTITGPASSTTITVRQARGILVTTPGN